MSHLTHTIMKIIPLKEHKKGSNTRLEIINSKTEVILTKNKKNVGSAKKYLMKTTTTRIINLTSKAY